jgi:3-oxoacyl-[acyl-carrier protein] reductase
VRLKNKIAIVTGGGSGFGEGIAKRFVEEGCKVIVNDLKPEGGERVAKALTAAGGQARFVQGDVSRAADWERLLKSTLDAYGSLDIVINNAGTTHRNQPLLDVTEEQFDRVYAVNVKSLYHSARAIVPYFRKKGGGVLITIASTAGVRPRPGLVWYNGSKGRVNVVNPVAGDTPLLAEFMGSDTPEMRAKFVASIPLGRFSKPVDVANACLYLASDEADFITGACIEVDGGRCV